MGVLGKDLFDFDRPRTHTMVRFGEREYWVEDRREGIPYGATLTALLDADVGAYQESLARLREALDSGNGYSGRLKAVKARLRELPYFNLFLRTNRGFNPAPKLEYYFQVGRDLELIQNRYTWFLDEAFYNAGSEKKKGQHKQTPAERICGNGLEALVTGVSLGADREVDASPVRVQFAMLNAEDDSLPTELVEKMYFDRLIDFAYVELMKGIQKGFIPKRCPNCGHWFLQQPGMTYTYCERIAPGETEKTCRDIGASQSFQSKLRENEIWKLHSRAYKKYFARVRKKTMTKPEFEAWSSEAERIRDEALQDYARASTAEERAEVAASVEKKLNRV